MRSERAAVLLATTVGAEPGPGPNIPTRAYVTTALDLYRVDKFLQTGHEGWNSCLLDPEVCIGLAQVIEGEVTDWTTIEAAELALQVLFWHERADVLVPAFKLNHNGFCGYARCEPARSALAFDLFKECSPQDYIYCVEEVSTLDGVIAASNISESYLLGKPPGTRSAAHLAESPAQAAAFVALPNHLGVPAYFASDVFRQASFGTGYSQKLYEAIRSPWDAAGDSIPVVDRNVRLPPLLAIVLDRARDRESIPEAILEVRSELAPVRAEMMELGERLRGVLDSSVGESEIEHSCQRVIDSFSAAFAASRHEAGTRPFLQLFKLIRSPIDVLVEKLNPDYESPDPRRIAKRTVAGSMFSSLLRTDSMYRLLETFFSATEARALAKRNAP